VHRAQDQSLLRRAEILDGAPCSRSVRRHPDAQPSCNRGWRSGRAGTSGAGPWRNSPGPVRWARRARRLPDTTEPILRRRGAGSRGIASAGLLGLSAAPLRGAQPRRGLGHRTYVTRTVCLICVAGPSRHR
jgi:hypothetical protein